MVLSWLFFFQKQSEVLPFPLPGSVGSRYCVHKKALVSLASADKSGGNFMTKINHMHNPILESKKGNVIFVYLVIN